MKRASAAAIASCCLLGPLAGSAEAEIAIGYSQSSPDTMTINVALANEDFVVTNPDNSSDYVFDTSCSGCSANLVLLNGTPPGMCSPASGQTITCDPAESGDEPYRLVFANTGTHTMEIGFAEGPGSAGGRFPAPITVNAAAATTVRSDPGADIDLKFNGGPAADHYGMGGGAELVSGGGGTDTVSYAGYASPADDANVTLDDVANDAVAGDVTTDNVFADVENVTGGSGDDAITGDADGNELRGGPGFDALDGKSGNNILRAEAGGATMTASIGADVFDSDPADGGEVSYAGRSDDLLVLPNGLADDGAAAEGDDVDSDVTRIVGGNGRNSLGGTGALQGVELTGGADRVMPGAGSDLYDGGGGTNHLDYSAPISTASPTTVRRARPTRSRASRA